MRLVKSRLDKDEKGERLAISEMETAMCNALQLLKCIIERKDNIVDLGEVWHSIDVEPTKGSWFVAQMGNNVYDTFVAEIEGKSIRECLESCDTKRWAYIKDLLPKGGA
ncbi:hypothetical protein [Ruminococcus sp.]|uniref:hypothetical protein n=1 Tax=Ruminococcus sp. TaxID=41978 RepID=UPI003F0F3CFA